MSSTLAVDVILRPRLGLYYSARRQRVTPGSTQAVYFDVVNVLTGALVPGATGASAVAWLPGTAGTDAPGQPLVVTEPTPGTLRVNVPSDIPGAWRVWMQITGPSVETGEIVYDVPDDGGAPVELSLEAWRSLQAAGAAAGASAGAVAGKVVVAGAVAEAAQPYVDEAAAQATAADQARSLAQGAQAQSEALTLVAQDASGRAGQSATIADQKAYAASLAAAQAQLASSLYPTVSAGLAGTAVGGYFSVAGDANSFSILYRNVGGTAVEQSRYPSQAAVEAIPASSGDRAGDDNVLLTDPDGKIMGRIFNGGGSIQVGRILLQSTENGATISSSDGRMSYADSPVDFTSSAPGGPLLAFVDDDGHLAALAADAPTGIIQLQGSPPLVVDGVPYNSARRFGVRGDGTDESAALMAAHDAAYAAGIRVLDFENLTVTAPSALYLGQVIFVGTGKLIGTYRKQIIRPYAGAKTPTLHNIVPSQHLPKFAPGSTVRVTIVGDSRVPASGSSHPSQGFWYAIKEAFRRQNPGVTPILTMRGIPSQRWTNLDALPTSFPQPWYSNTSRAWLEYVRDTDPDIVIFNFGMNDRNELSIAALNSVMTKIDAWPKVPRKIIMTNPAPSTQGSDWGTRDEQEYRDNAAGIQRTIARARSWGLIDLHDFLCGARDGFSYENQALENVANDAAVQIPYTLPECSEFMVNFYAAAQFLPAGGKSLDITLSSRAGNLLRLRRASGGLLQVSVQTTGIVSSIDPAAYTSLPWTDLPGTQPLTDLRLAIHVSNTGLVSIEHFASTPALATDRSSPIWEGYVERFGGLYTPQIAFSDGSTLAVQMRRAAIGKPRQFMPVGIDEDFYGRDVLVGGEYIQGNGKNHESSMGALLCHDPVVFSCNFNLNW